MPYRRSPPPWDLEDNGACFIVRDHAGQALAKLSKRARGNVYGVHPV